MESSEQQAPPSRLARLTWQGKLAIIAVLITLGIAFFQYLRLRHLPGPYYGGDLYAHHGFALNYMANGFWADPYFVGHYAFYPWLGNYLFIAVSLLPGVSLMKAEIFVGLLTTTLSALAFYFLGNQLFKNKTHALLFLLFSLDMRGIPDGAPNNVPWMITIPFWFAFWLKAEETGKTRDKLLAGLFIGLTSLAHVAFFLAGMALFAFTITVETLRAPQKKEAIISALKLYEPMLAVGFVISLLFYGPIIVNYHAKTLNPLFQYNGPAIETLGVGWAFRELFSTLFNFTSLTLALLSSLIILGLGTALMNLNKKTPRYAIFWLIAGTLVPLHHLITRPLLGRWILPGHVGNTSLALLVFLVYGISVLFQVAQKKWPRPTTKRIAFIAVLILVLALFARNYESYRSNRWVQFGESLDTPTQSWLAFGEWMRNNTDANTVVLGGDETCFAMNAVSGRKCVFVRRTHANYFVDVEQRYADGIVLLYGNNSVLTKLLIDNYSVDYVLIDTFMMQSSVNVDAKFESYLGENNVTFTKIRERKDPSVPNSRVFDLLRVPFQPLNKELESRLTPVAVLHVTNQPAIRLFKVAR